MAKIKKNKAIKYRIFPTEEQIQMIEQTFGCCRFLWNHMLNDEHEFYVATDKHYIPTPARYKKDFPFLKQVDSLALANVQLNINEAFSDFFSGTKKHPKFKSKKHNPVNSYTTNCQYSKPTSNNPFPKPTIRLIHKAIHLPKIGDIPAKIHRVPMKGWKLKSATISKESTGKYYCSVLYEIIEDEPIEVEPVFDTSIGLDYSSPSFYIDSDGNAAESPTAYRKMQDKLAKEQRRLSRMQKGSKNYNEQRIKINLLHEKIKNRRLDFAHQESRRITNAHSSVCLETINLRAMSQTLNLGKSTTDNGFGMFRRMLEYKLADQGKKLLLVGRWYPSSKTCGVCGFINKDLKLSDRDWICPNCGSFLMRDTNAASNIRAKAIADYFDVA